MSLDLQNVTLLCIRESDFEPSFLEKQNADNITIQRAKCVNCGEVVLEKSKIGLERVRCMHCVRIS